MKKLFKKGLIALTLGLCLLAPQKVYAESQNVVYAGNVTVADNNPKGKHVYRKEYKVFYDEHTNTKWLMVYFYEDERLFKIEIYNYGGK